MLNKSKFIFVTGGVVSSLGKGVTAASLGALLKEMGYKINIKKCDPYLNVDPGTMNPTQHGEVFITDDGYETDLDFGHYERFLGQKMHGSSSITSGKIYTELLSRERSGKYLGQTVQVVPHLVNLTKEFITKDCADYDFNIIEIGGTVGDIEGNSFLETARQMSMDTKKYEVMFIHVTLLPYIRVAEELKTKPTQHSVKTLMSSGILPNIIVCRSEISVPKKIRQKIGLFCNVDEEDVIEMPDISSIYEAPILLLKNKLDIRVMKHFNIKPKPKGSKFLKDWKNFDKKIKSAESSINVVIIGKYGETFDPYKSVVEAIKASAIHQGVKPNIKIISAANINATNVDQLLHDIDAVVMAGGFGVNHIEDKIRAIKYIRENKIPFLGICLGMQLAIIEFCRNVLKIKDAGSTETNKNLSIDNAVVDVIKKLKSKNANVKYERADNEFDGEMNLGASNVEIKRGTLAHDIYGNNVISERHRHRYQIMPHYEEMINEMGGIFSGTSEDLNLPEIFELSTKESDKNSSPFFLCTQFHPEFNSTPLNPHPLFKKLIEVGMSLSQKNK
ncbi:CTP synthase [Rickettsiales bacterium]|nr:CTP synthase [Rickettsiales bacterium]